MSAALMHLRDLLPAILVLVTACVSAGTNEVPLSGGSCARHLFTSGQDSDRDGISDVCEHRLAQQFAPILNTSARACNAIPRDAPQQLGGGYLHVVMPAGSRIRVAYLPAYFVDCGWSGPKCRLPGVNCAPHSGDSELIVIELAGGPAWKVAGVFLSAHCFGRSQAGCRWYRVRVAL